MSSWALIPFICMSLKNERSSCLRKVFRGGKSIGKTGRKDEKEKEEEVEASFWGPLFLTFTFLTFLLNNTRWAKSSYFPVAFFLMHAFLYLLLLNHLLFCCCCCFVYLSFLLDLSLFPFVSRFLCACNSSRRSDQREPLVMRATFKTRVSLFTPSFSEYNQDISSYIRVSLVKPKAVDMSWSWCCFWWLLFTKWLFAWINLLLVNELLVSWNKSLSLEVEVERRRQVYILCSNSCYTWNFCCRSLFCHFVILSLSLIHSKTDTRRINFKSNLCRILCSFQALYVLSS